MSEMDEAEEDRGLRTTSSSERTEVVQNRTPEDEGLRSRSSAQLLQMNQQQMTSYVS